MVINFKPTTISTTNNLSDNNRSDSLSDILSKIGRFIRQRRVQSTLVLGFLAFIPVTYYLRVTNRRTELQLSTSGEQNEREQSIKKMWTLKLRAATLRAMNAKVLKPLSVRPVLLQDRELPFVMSIVNAKRLGKKNANISAKTPVDAFQQLDPALLIEHEYGDGYMVALNKFPVTPQHGLLISREFTRQDTFLTVRDWQVFWSMVRDANALGFYNCGPASGSSQPRKHLQFTPLHELSESFPHWPAQDRKLEHIPVQILVDQHRQKSNARELPGEPFTLEAFNFPHAICMLGGDISHQMDDIAAHILTSWYRKLIVASKVGEAPEAIFKPGMVELDAPPHNVLMTPNWLLVVPRSRSKHEGVGINALGYAGLILVKENGDFDRLKEITPLEVLHHCAAR